MSGENIEVEYDGSYPNLCSGYLVVVIDDKRWEFPKHCMQPGGDVWFDEDWSEHVEQGPWYIDNWPEGFPEDLKDDVTEKVNEEVEWGNCGGCV